MHAPKLYYQVTPGIWAGSYIGNGVTTYVEAQLAWLLAQEISVVIDLTAPSDDLPSYVPQLTQYAPQITWISFAISDGDVPAPATMLAILDAMSDAQHQNRSVYVHCWRGLSRTGMVATCWLMRQGMTVDAARAHIIQLLPPLSPHVSPDFQVQIDFVYNWQEPDAVTAQRWRRWRDLFRGALIGGAIGDALGVTNEHNDIHTKHHSTDLVGGGTFGLPAGWWSDDTSGMLCVVKSLILQYGFDAHDQARRMLDWWQNGDLTCGGRTYDIGNVTMMALYQYMATNNPYSNITTDHAAGPGSLIRVAPIGLFFADNPAKVCEYARDMSRITHASRIAIDACRIVATMMARTLYCQDKNDLFTNYWPCIVHDAVVQSVLAGSYTQPRQRNINGSFVLETLDMVLWSLWNHDDYASGVLALANMAGMPGASCTVYGQIAGAFYGESAIPLQWRQKIARYYEIGWYADTLLRMAWKSLPHTNHIPAGFFAEA